MMARFGVASCGAALILAASPAAIGEFPEPRPDITHRPLPAPSTVARPEPNKRTTVARGATIVGVASMYNPHRPGVLEGGPKTASGELYDSTAWTAAIQIGLREKFRGVRHGRDHRHTYALVESADKQAIVKINDVGQLKPGRVIDFNEQTMRYFDPTLQRGLIHGVKVTPLLGDDWPTGPIESDS